MAVGDGGCSASIQPGGVGNPSLLSAPTCVRRLSRASLPFSRMLAPAMASAMPGRPPTGTRFNGTGKVVPLGSTAGHLFGNGYNSSSVIEWAAPPDKFKTKKMRERLDYPRKIKATV